MGAAMAVSMAAMMLPTAAPFFLGYWRVGRRPGVIATVVLTYVAVWAVIGAVVGRVLEQVMLPPSLTATAVAVAVALSYAVTPWGRWAREECRCMSIRAPRSTRVGSAAAEGAVYAACCVVCSAGLMPVVIVLGMANPVVVVAGAAAMLVYKLVPPLPLDPSAGGIGRSGARYDG